MKTKFALVLSGGGFNCAYQVGAINYIAENWRAISGLSTPMKFDIIAGISGGAINGSLVAMDKLSLLHNLWVNKIGKIGASEIYNSDFIDTHSTSDKLKIKIDLKALAKKYFSKIKVELGLFDKVGLLFSKNKRKVVIDSYLSEFYQVVKEELSEFKAIADNSPLHEKLKLYLDRGQIKDTIFTCGFVSLDSGLYHSVKHTDFSSEEDFVLGVSASSAIPFIWNPVNKISFQSGTQTIQSFNNVDGGVMNVSPLGDVIKLIAEDQEECRYKLFVINCNSGIPKQEDYSSKSIGSIIARSFYQLTLNEVFNNDINQFMQLNEITKQLEKINQQVPLTTNSNRPIKSFEAVIISPERADELGNPLVANDKLIYQRMAQGYSSARKNIIF